MLDLLATVYYEMPDLPAAGAIWFTTGRDDRAAQDSIAAWRERHGNDEARWHSIPSPIRSWADSTHLAALKGSAAQIAARRRSGWNALGAFVESRWDRLVPIAFGAVVFGFLAMVGIGLWTVLHWIWL